MKHYFNDQRISQSKLKDWMACPNLYKAKHVDKVIGQETTKAMLYGSIVDMLVTQPDQFDKEYAVVSRRPKGETYDEEDRMYINPSEIQLAQTAADKVNAQPVMEIFRQPWMKTQVQLYTDTKKAMLDYFGIDKKGTAWIADLKTMRNIDKVQDSFYNWRWDIQLAFYRMIAKEKCPQIKRFNIFIIGIDKTVNMKFGVWKVMQKHFSRYEKMIDKYMPMVGSPERIARGLCTACPPEINCEYSLFKEKDIGKL